MGITKAAIKAMGYAEHSEEDCLEILFGAIQVFSLKGLQFEHECKGQVTEVTAIGKNCTVAIGESINELSKALVGEVYVEENEEEWIAERKLNPPFLAVYFRERKWSKLRGGFRKEADGDIYLYDGFSEEKKEIRNWRESQLPNIVISLVLQLSTKDVPVELVPAHESIFGKTKDGTTVFDIQLKFGPVELTKSKSHTTEVINSYLKKTRLLNSVITAEDTRHLFSAFSEKDKLRQFLNYFLFIERYTHKTYKEISKDTDLSSFVRIPSRLDSVGDAFFEEQVKNAKGLLQRFFWCSLIKWENIEASDVEFLKHVKTTRDNVAHGNDYKEEDFPIKKLRLLSLKLLGGS